jgi:hypothetical protein
MTPEELRAARIAEANRRSREYGSNPAGIIADMWAENWTPPVVDPDLLAARAWAETTDMGAPTLYDDGSYDTEPEIIGFLAGCTRGREETKGLVEALEWYAYRYNYLAAAPDGHDYVKRARAALASAKRGG